jgi:tetraacyldisaccharide 4'-kinase
MGMRACLEHWIGRQWQKQGVWAYVMQPLAMLFGVLAAKRRERWLNAESPQISPVPLIIVGNLTVGGAGKTPVVLALAEALCAAGYFPGIISRGYGGKITKPTAVDSNSLPDVVGDEPLLMAKRLERFGVPVWVYRERFQTVLALLEAHPKTNVIISDDGLQHYALARCFPRDVELVVMDARGGGNGYLLPAGPLREPLSRPRSATVYHGINADVLTPIRAEYDGAFFQAHWQLGMAYQLTCPHIQKSLPSFGNQKILAAAGIGYPARFFNSLEQAGLTLNRTLALPDHFDFSVNPFLTASETIILITEKDAVKCAEFKDDRLWVVPGNLMLPDELLNFIRHSIDFVGPLFCKGISYGSTVT